MNKSISVGLTRSSNTRMIALVFAAVFVARVALSHEGRNGDADIHSSSSSSNSSANHEPSVSERIGGSMTAVQAYRERLAAEKAELEKKERELSKKTSTRPSVQAEKEMDEAPLAFKGVKRETMMEKVTEMVDPETSKQLSSVREQIAAKEKELKETDNNLASHRDALKRARNAEQKQQKQDTEGKRNGGLGRGDAREVPGNIGLGGVRDRTG